MRNLSLLTLLVLLPFLTVAQEAAQLAANALQACTQEQGIVGIAAAYSVDGTTVWSGADGMRCLDDKLPFEQNTVSRPASIAKSMTAVAIMQLVEKQQLTLDTPIINYLPELNGLPLSAITTRQLLAHTSGIGGYQDDESENQTAYPDLAAAMAVFQERPLLFDPGSQFFYTTYGYVVLGRIIEAVAHTSYAEYMQANIWAPAGMQHTGIEQPSQAFKGQSCLYHKERRRAKPASANNLSNRIPGGGLYTTVPDLLRFGHAIVDHRLISAESLAQMLEIQRPKKEGNPYGLGWFLYGPPPYENLVIGHSGEQTGSAAQLMIVPKSKTVVAVLANTSGTWKEVVALASELLRISEL